MEIMKECPVCGGSGSLKVEETRMGLRRRIAIRLKGDGYTIREIMVFMGYKTPSNVHRLLTKNKKN